MNAVLFDFDRTLVNLGDYVPWKEAKEKMMDVYIASGVSPEFIKQYQSIFILLIEIIDELSKSLPQVEVIKIQSHASKILENYELMGVNQATLMVGALDALKFVKDKKLKVGVVSSNAPSSVKQCMRKLGILKYVDYISGRDPKLRIKPYPDQIVLCLKKLKCNPENSVMIGDNLADLRSAKALDVTFIAVITGRVSRSDFESEKADYIIQNLEELPGILLKLFKTV